MTNDQKFRLWLAVINRGMPLLRTIAFWGFLALDIKFAAEAIEALAGQQTSATFVWNAIVSLQLDRWAAYAVALIASLYGLRQRHLRRKAIERLAARPAELEKMLDPKRTSSDLPTTGVTRHEDK